MRKKVPPTSVGIAKILEIDPLYVSTLRQLPIDGPPSYESIRDGLLPDQQDEHPWVQIARCVLAVTARADSYDSVRHWITTLTAPLNGDAQKLLNNYALGVTLGLFQSIVWLDRYCVDHAIHSSTFESSVEPIIVRLVTDNRSFEGVTEFSAGTGWELELSEAVKAYVRHGRIERLRNVRRLLDKITAAFEGRDFEQVPLHVISRAVLDQLCYAVFGQLGAEMRLKAIQQFLDPNPEPPVV